MDHTVARIHLLHPSTVGARLDVAATRDQLSDAATVNHLVPPETELLQPWNRIDEFEGESAKVECQQRDRLFSASDVLTAGRHSAHQAGTRPPDNRPTASNVALFSPMVRAHSHGGPATVNADLQAISHNLIITPSELNTLVYNPSSNN
ncbi:hypothetical protein PtB15_3B536 [Puccinia triticina]|nr:hypothetical protein PtB15_3B536 [Puccinia triticina]